MSTARARGEACRLAAQGLTRSGYRQVRSRPSFLELPTPGRPEERTDRGRVHLPVCWLEPARPATSATSSSTTPSRPRTRWSSAAARATAGSTSPAASSSTQVSGVAKGLMAAGVRPGDRVALMSQDPLRVDADRLRDLDAPARVTVPIYETSSAEQVQWILSDSGASGLLRRDARPRRPSSTRSAATWRRSTHVWTIDAGAVDDAHRRPAQRCRDEELEARRTDGGAERPGDDHLHLGHHRRPEGLRAHPRQLPLRGGQRRQREGQRRDAGRRLPGRGRLDAALPPAGPRVRPDDRGRRA